MDPPAILIVLAAGLAMGWINNVAGGAGVLGLLAFEHAVGMPLSTANPSTRPAAVAIGLFAFLGYLRAGRRPPLRAWLQGLVAVPGAWLGTRLALDLPDLVFRGYLGLVMVLLLWQQLGRRAADAADGPRPLWLSAAGCFLIGLHMGYVQVGTGLVATLVLASACRHDLVAVNVAKSAIVVLTSVTSVGGFWAASAIAWQPALWLAAGAAAGSYAASHWSVQKGSTAVRRVVIAIAVLTLLDQIGHVAGILA